MQAIAVDQVLVFRSSAYRFALPVSEVVEVMRPQPVTSLAVAAAFVDGLAVIRGQPVPVVRLARLFEPGSQEAAPRLITVRCAARLIALAVAAVDGIRQYDRTQLSSLPALLSGAEAGAITSLTTLNGALTLVLGTGKIVPDAVWAELDARARA